MPTPDSPADHILVTTRLLRAPRPLVFRAWTSPEHVGRWWGPDGFSTTTQEMDFRVGGKWRYIMHGPDGTDYNNWIMWTRIVEPEVLEYDHGENDGEARWFQVVVNFTEEDGGTRVTMNLIAPSKDALQALLKGHAKEGADQHLANLENYVAGME